MKSGKKMLPFKWKKKNPVMSNKNLKQFFPEVHEKYEAKE